MKRLKMASGITVAPSILSADWGYLARDLEGVHAAGADWIHVDVMDGHFVPNITFGPAMVGRIRELVDLPLDVHLMIDRPERYAAEFVRAGADVVTVHPEATSHVHRVLSMIREAGAAAGIAYNPGTPLMGLENLLGVVDLVLIMTVNPGFGGQSFIPEMVPKIRSARGLVGDGAALEVDGGVTDQTAPGIVAAGAQILVAGSYVFGSDDMARAIKSLRGG